MSESNAPFNHPGQPESADSTPDWENPFADLAEEMNLQGDSSVEDLLFETDAKAFPQGLEHSPAVNPTAAIAAWSDAAATASADVTDLISLIQELNQCNSILLDRVSQLEEALESSQIALQAEVGRSQENSCGSPPVGAATPADLTSAQEQIISLFNQLEFAHQASQRQQILIETLTGQVDSSQERVAELERESALLQQRYNEQAQFLSQSETTNRDLQARLHRQQRYTLQFKAALEKCLEVPAPQYDLGVEVSAAAGENPFLLKTQQIQPWSSETEVATSHFPWMKLYPNSLDEMLGGESQPVVSSSSAPDFSAPDFSAPDFSAPEKVEPSMAFHQSALLESNLKLPIIELPPSEPALSTSMAEPDVKTSRGETTAEPLESPELVSYVASPEGFPEPGLTHQVDAAVRPLADLLAEAVHSIVPASAPAPDVRPALLPEPALPSAVSQQPEDAEDALWQDLARLIEVSTEDVVRASLSGDFSAFEAIDFDALQPANSGSPVESSVSNSSVSNSSVSNSSVSNSLVQPLQTAEANQRPQLELAVPVDEVEPSLEPVETGEHRSIPALSQPSWPSPVVYPLRPAKKQRSSGAVDLPAFLRPETNPLAT